MKYIQLLLVVMLVVPVSANASHNRSVDTSDLDDDIVEEFKIPVVLAIDYFGVTPDYGAPRGGGTRSHEGQDFLSPLGTPIVSPTEAVVIGTGVWSGGGNYVQTANPGGERFRYMHLDEIAAIRPGDELSVGDFIGTVGDTGNAAPGAYHLHFEVLDEDGDPQDPYPRLSNEPWTAEEKADSIRNALQNIDDEDEYAELLVETFSEELYAIEQTGERLPREIRNELKDSDVADLTVLLKQLDALIRSIPSLITIELQEGDSNTAVSLLQTYITYVSDGPAAQRLANAGSTGYYGSITSAAVAELQTESAVVATGNYSPETRLAWIELAK